MYKMLIVILITFCMTGCNDDKNTNTKIHLDGKKLLEQKCSRCHNPAFPPKDFKNEKAPSFMTMSFHFHNWMKGNSEYEKMSQFVEFAKDYVTNPTVQKSYCPPDMLKQYGLMPSQKGKVTSDEIAAIIKYIYKNYTPEKLAKKQEALEKLHALPKGEQIAIKYKCITCHRVDKDLVGPSFQNIAKRYKNDQNSIENSIKYGAKGKWEKFKSFMPPFHNINKNDLEELSKWILN